MSVKCFISHNSKDKAFARRLAQELREVGFEPWLDEWSIFAGESISGKVQSAIASSDYFIVILSPSSVGSNWVREELRAALAIRLATKPDFILPILLQDCDLPLFLHDYKYVDFRRSFRGALAEVIRALKKQQAVFEPLSVRQIREDIVVVPRGRFEYSYSNRITRLEYAFQIDKYPVSRRKFLSFVFSGDFRRRRFWHDRAWSWMTDVAWRDLERLGEQELLRDQYGHLLSAPDEFDYPIAFRTAYEAEAYCSWVGGRLPKDVEWDRAAHGERNTPYPWGDTFLEGRCHTEGDMRFRVDDYPEGISPHGLYNMAGFKAEFIGELADDNPSDLRDDILTRGWIAYADYARQDDIPKYSIWGRGGCFPVAAQAHPITFRCVYPIESPYDAIYGQTTTQDDILASLPRGRRSDRG